MYSAIVNAWVLWRYPLNGIGYVELHIRTPMTEKSNLQKMALIRGKEAYGFATVFGRSFLIAGIPFGVGMGIFFAIMYQTPEALIVGVPAGLFFGIFMGLFSAFLGIGKTLYVEFSNEKEKESFFSNLNIGMLQIKYEMKLKDDEFMLFKANSRTSKIFDVSVILGENGALIIAPKFAMKKIERFV